LFGPRVAVADFNGDGNPDMASENDFSAVTVRLGDGAGGFGAESLFNLNLDVVQERASAVIAKDLNADGKIDLVVASWASFSVLMGNGDGTFGASTHYVLLPASSGGLGSVTAGD